MLVALAHSLAWRVVSAFTSESAVVIWALPACAPAHPVAACEGGNVVASEDGKTVALWTVTKQSRLLVGLSADGGRTLRPIYQQEIDPKLNIEPSATLTSSSIAFEVSAEAADGSIVPRAIATLPFEGGALAITELPPEVSGLCMASQHVAVALRIGAVAQAIPFG